jgi:hypothetical protein
LARGEMSMNSVATCASRKPRAAASASASARSRPGVPSRATLAWPSVSRTSTGECPLRRTFCASSAAASSALAGGVPRPPGRLARQRLARTSERVGGSSRSAHLPRKAITATSSRRT